MTKHIDLDKYTNFVEGVTSQESNDVNAFQDRITELTNSTDVNIPLLLTAAIGMSAESGEFSELPKKILFQGKEITEDVRFHMKRELGDIMWYWTNACRALGYTPDEVIAENVGKLEARYPGGKFDPFFSENRKDGDL